MNRPDSDETPQQTSKLIAIVRGKKSARPQIVGYIRVFWCNSLRRWVTVPDSE